MAQQSQQPIVLIADDDAGMRGLLRLHLETAGFSVVEAGDGYGAMELMSERFDAALFDLFMPGPSGVECVEAAKERMPGVPALVISGKGDLDTAVDAMRRGAFDYVTKPIDGDQLAVRLREAVRTRRLAAENLLLRGSIGEPTRAPGFVAVDVRSKKLVEQASRVAGLESTVLLTGGSGSGKSTLARLIHAVGRGKAGGPFVSVPCGSLPRELVEVELFGHERGAFAGAGSVRAGKAEQADGGTLFLDEVTDLPIDVQPKLVSFLQERAITRLGGAASRSVNVRVIAATGGDIEAAVRAGSFREDLYYRLNVVRLDMPALSERRADIAPIARSVLERIAQRRGLRSLQLSDGAREAIESHAWPGNVRELENVLERASAFVEGEVIGQSDLNFGETVLARRAGPQGSSRPAPNDLAGRTLADIERLAITQTLERCGGNRAQAAKLLGVSEKTIYNKINQYQLRGKV